MARAHGADVTIIQQFDVTHLRVGVQRRIDGEVEAAGGQFLGGFAALGQETLDAHAGRQTAQALKQWRQENLLGEVGHADAVGLAGLLRVEGAALLHGDTQQLQGITHRADDVLRHGRGHHALGGAHEQRVVEGFTQAGEGVGNRRLSDADDLSGTGQVGLGVDGVEDDEEVQVHLGQVHAGSAPGASISIDHISVMNVHTR